MISNSRDAEMVVAQFFARSKAAGVASNESVLVNGKRRFADLILQFGSHRVLIETKLIRVRNALRNVRTEAIAQVDEFRRAARIHDACVVIFVRGPIPVTAPIVEKHVGGTIYSIVIQLGS